MPVVDDGAAVASEDSTQHLSGLGYLQKGLSAVATVYESMDREDFNEPPILEGNDPDTINAVTMGIMVGVGVLTLIAGARDLWVYSSTSRRSATSTKHSAGDLRAAPSGAASPAKDRPWAWAAVLMTLSYFALIPGLYSNLISMTMVVNVVGYRIRVHPESGQPCFTEDSPGLARMLYKEGSWIGGSSVVLFAIVLPILEVIFVVSGEVLRGKCGEAWNRRIRVMIYYAQHKSKWASPYMSALILLVCLVRKLNHPDLILFDARLDIGFFCFSFFCIGATASAIGFPELSEEDRGCCSCCAGCGRVSEWLEKKLAGMGRRNLLYTTWFLAVLFVWLLERGCHLPAMSMSFTDQTLFPPQGRLPVEFKSTVERLGVIDLMATDISFQGSMKLLYKWAIEGEIMSAFNLALLAVFTILIPCLDGLVVAMLASLLYLEGNNPAWKKTRENFRWVIEILKRLSMLDVSILGIYVISAIMLVFRRRGITIVFGLGHLYLHVAEIAHWLLHRLISCLGRDDEAVAKRLAPSGEFDHDNFDNLPESVAGCCSAPQRSWWSKNGWPGKPRRGDYTDVDAVPLTQWPSRGESSPGEERRCWSLGAQSQSLGLADLPASPGAASPGKQSAAWLPFQSDASTSPGSASSFLSWSPTPR